MQVVLSNGCILSPSDRFFDARIELIHGIEPHERLRCGRPGHPRY